MSASTIVRPILEHYSDHVSASGAALTSKGVELLLRDASQLPTAQLSAIWKSTWASVAAKREVKELDAEDIVALCKKIAVCQRREPMETWSASDGRATLAWGVALVINPPAVDEGGPELAESTILDVADMLGLQQQQQQQEQQQEQPSTPSTEDTSSGSSSQWAISINAWNHYNTLFLQQTAEAKDSFLQGGPAITFLRLSKLSDEVLRSVWKLCDTDKDGMLNLREFIYCMHVIRNIKATRSDVPVKLPQELVDAYDSHATSNPNSSSVQTPSSSSSSSSSSSALPLSISSSPMSSTTRRKAATSSTGSSLSSSARTNSSSLPVQALHSASLSDLNSLSGLAREKKPRFKGKLDDEVKDLSEHKWFTPLQWQGKDSAAKQEELKGLFEQCMALVSESNDPRDLGRYLTSFCYTGLARQDASPGVAAQALCSSDLMWRSTTADIRSYLGGRLKLSLDIEESKSKHSHSDNVGDTGSLKDDSRSEASFTDDGHFDSGSTGGGVGNNKKKGFMARMKGGMHKKMDRESYIRQRAERNKDNQRILLHDTSANHGLVVVRVLEGSTIGVGTGSTVHLYCEAMVFDESLSQSLSYNYYKTATRYHTHDPFWNEEFVLNFTSSDNCIVFNVSAYACVSLF
jgi:hypothetical protein